MASTKFVDAAEAQKLVSSLGGEFFVIQNPSYIHPELEVVPLAPKMSVVRDLTAAVMDMDGTTTTTEDLCLHSLEYMVRVASGKTDKATWAGLDVRDDYPHIIGNSTTKHVEFLLGKYAEWLKADLFAEAFVRAAAWTVRHSQDEGRTAEVIANLGYFGISALAAEAATMEDDDLVTNHAAAVAGKLAGFDARLRAAIDVYYQRYHFILSLIAEGDRAALSEELPFMPADVSLISPMPGVAEFLALVKGLIAESDGLYDHVLALFREHPRTTYDPAKEAEYRQNFAALASHFSQSPMKVAVVTSSIRYEAQVVLGEVFSVLRKQVAEWPVADGVKNRVLEAFAGHESYYDGFITATDSSEMRLKPHRDLYSMALHRLGIGKEDFDTVVGFEDSESGTVAIRAAGVNLCVAVPFVGTEFHNLEAACHTLPAGLLQAMLEHRLFLRKD